jgi:plastocyanin
MLRVLAICALLLALALAGCSDDAPEGSPGPTPSTSQGTTTAEGTTTTSAGGNSSTSSSSPTPRPAQTFQVDIQGSAFKDGTKTIQKGDTVTWVMKDSGTTHTATSDDGSTFDSGNLVALPSRDTFSFTFNSLGDFPYHCEVHPGMKATITVVAALPA